MRVLLQVGDRVRLVAAVARVFDDATLEIGVDVSSAAVGAEAFTPINSGFLTVSLVEQGTGRTLRLPPSLPIAGDAASTKRHEAAMVRRTLRVQRRQMFSLRPDAFAFSAVHTLLEELRICNVMALLRAEYVQLQEVPRTADHNPRTTTYLWHVELRSAYAKFERDLMRTVAALRQRVSHEEEAHEYVANGHAVRVARAVRLPRTAARLARVKRASEPHSVKACKSGPLEA